MHTKNEVGSLISKGLTTKEIQARIKDFPEHPTAQYFINLGYKPNTAKKYLLILRKNNCTPEPIKEEAFIMSSNADVNNILLDTCALEYEESINLMLGSKSVTVLYSIVKEFDSISQKDNVSSSLKYRIREQTRLMLSPNNKKYRLVPYGYKNDGYTDEIILDYLLSLPVSERPTILTADNNLALRASCFGLNYIVYINSLKQTKKKYNKIQNTSKNNNHSITNLGVQIKYDEPIISIQKYNPSARIFVVKNDNTCQNISNLKQIEKTNVEYLCVIAKSKRYNVIKIQKICLKQERREFRCTCEEDIKKLENIFHSTILDSVKKLL